MQMERSHPHGGDRVAAALEAQGVTCVFTLCGGHISPILTASKARGIRIVDCRDEATAVFAADASARLTGLPGVAAVTAGPGLTNTITALKNAQLAQSPVVLFGGAAPTALQGRGALQDIDQRPLIAPHVKLFNKVKRVADLAPAVEEAFAVAREGVPGPVCIECPVDLLYDEANIRQWYADAAGKGTSIAERNASSAPAASPVARSRRPLSSRAATKTEWIPLSPSQTWKRVRPSVSRACSSCPSSACTRARRPAVSSRLATVSGLSLRRRSRSESGAPVHARYWSSS